MSKPRKRVAVKGGVRKRPVVRGSIVGGWTVDGLPYSPYPPSPPPAPREILQGRKELDQRIAVLAKAHDLRTWREVVYWLSDHPDELKVRKTRVKNGKAMIDWIGGEAVFLREMVDILIDEQSAAALGRGEEPLKRDQAIEGAIRILQERNPRYVGHTVGTLVKVYRSKKYK